MYRCTGRLKADSIFFSVSIRPDIEEIKMIFQGMYRWLDSLAQIQYERCPTPRDVSQKIMGYFCFAITAVQRHENRNLLVPIKDTFVMCPDILASLGHMNTIVCPDETTNFLLTT